jgi:hypothetical protein
VDLEAVAQGADALSESVGQNAVKRKRAVYIGDEVFNPQFTAAGDGQCKHGEYYTTWQIPAISFWNNHFLF